MAGLRLPYYNRGFAVAAHIVGNVHDEAGGCRADEEADYVPQFHLQRGRNGLADVQDALTDLRDHLRESLGDALCCLRAVGAQRVAGKRIEEERRGEELLDHRVVQIASNSLAFLGDDTCLHRGCRRRFVVL